MNPIRTNKPVFFGDDGEVLKSGQIYIGQPNQWPLSFPKTVTLQDSAGSQFTAAQPLTTNNQGRIEYNGKSVMALVDGDYSILVRDRNGVTVGEGYTPFVENAADGPASTESVTQIGLLLEDIQSFDVTPGETVSNVGRLSANDGLGAEWLVVSSTGSPADDINIIDFDNGTQGQRINNFLYREELQSDAPGEGAALITTESGENVEQALATTLSDAQQFATDIAHGASGAPRIDGTVSAAIRNGGIPNGEIGSEKLQAGTAERDWVLARVSELSAGAVGSYAFARQIGTQDEATFGFVKAGSGLRPSNADNTDAGSGALSGSWRCLGYSSVGNAEATLWLRIS